MHYFRLSDELLISEHRNALQNHHRHPRCDICAGAVDAADAAADDVPVVDCWWVSMNSAIYRWSNAI